MFPLGVHNAQQGKKMKTKEENEEEFANNQKHYSWMQL